MSGDGNGPAGTGVARVRPEDAVAFSWGSIQWLVNGELHAEAGITFGLVQIDPGCNNPRHLHPNCDEVLYLLEGTLEHSIGDEIVQLSPETALWIPRNVAHNGRNPGRIPARMVVAYSSGDRQTVLLDTESE